MNQRNQSLISFVHLLKQEKRRNRGCAYDVEANRKVELTFEDESFAELGVKTYLFQNRYKPNFFFLNGSHLLPWTG